MSRVCSQDRSEVFGDNDTLCPKHVCPLVDATDQPPAPQAPEPMPNRVPERVGVPGPDTERRKAWSLDRCWNCGREAVEGNTRCTNTACGRSLTPPALHIRFRDGAIELSEGGRAELGRLGEHQRVFRDFPNVSRHHAVVRVDADGSAWVEPHETPNGTFLNDVEIQPTLSRRLVSDDRLRFARNAEGSITLYER